MSVQPKEAGGQSGGESREASVVRQVKEMLGKLPPAYDPFEVKDRFVFFFFNVISIFTRIKKNYCVFTD